MSANCCLCNSDNIILSRSSIDGHGHREFSLESDGDDHNQVQPQYNVPIYMRVCVCIYICLSHFVTSFVNCVFVLMSLFLYVYIQVENKLASASEELEELHNKVYFLFITLHQTRSNAFYCENTNYLV